MGSMYYDNWNCQSVNRRDEIGAIMMPHWAKIKELLRRK